MYSGLKHVAKLGLEPSSVQTQYTLQTYTPPQHPQPAKNKCAPKSVSHKLCKEETWCIITQAVASIIFPVERARSSIGFIAKNGENDQAPPDPMPPVISDILLSNAPGGKLQADCGAALAGHRAA